MEFLGIGDLHFDGPLIKYLPNLNEIIANECRSVFAYARKNGVRNIFFYGDIAHRPNISMEAQVEFYRLLSEANDLRVHVIAGNHDFQSRKDSIEGTKSSLEFFALLQRSSALKHVSFYVDEPEEVVIDQEPVHFMPWPAKKTKPKVLNVMHIEVAGSNWDTGRPVEEAVDTRMHRCVVGHIHTNQKIRNTYFSGTLYQTTFGESQDKYFHHASYKEGKLKVRNIKHKPYIRLHNIVLEEAPGRDSIPSEEGNLCKVFVKKNVVLEPTFLKDNPSVVKINSFSTKEELKDLMKEELKLDYRFVELDQKEYLVKWLKSQGLDKKAMKKVLEVHDRLQESDA